MIIIRTIKYFFAVIHSKFKKRREFPEDIIDPKPNFLKRFIDNFYGEIYHKIQSKKEGLRVNKYNKDNHTKEEKVGLEFAKHTKKIFISLFITLILTSVIDFTSSYLFFGGHSPDLIQIEKVSSVLQKFLEVAIASISAVLGLIFALYAVGFQITTDKYSSDVADYINNELVGNFFFKLLVFTDLFLIFSLIKINFISINPVATFFVAVVLVSLSVCGIIIFKNHYLTILKPKSIFTRILQESKEAINTATKRNNYGFDSISIIYASRDKLTRLLSITGSLFDDLKRAENWNDIIYAPVVMGDILSLYFQRKKYLDTDRSWWFPQEYKEMKADDSTRLILKLNFELKGSGPLNTPMPNYTWVEDQIFDWLKYFNEQIENTKEKNKFTLQIINTYQTLLAGDYEKDKNGHYKKTVFGAYENQEIVIFDRALKLFFDLYTKLDLQNKEVVSSYINVFFATTQVILNGYDYKSFEKEIDSLVDANSRLIKNKEYTLNSNFPKEFYEKINDYYDRLEVEHYVEGKILTPKNLLLDEIVPALKKKESDQFEKYTKVFWEQQKIILNDLLKAKEYKAFATVIRAGLEWFSRLLYLNKSELAESQYKLVQELGVYFLFIPKEIVVEMDFQLQLERMIFPALLEDCHNLSYELIKILISTIQRDLTNLELTYQRYRSIIILGGFIYLQAQFKENNSFLIRYVDLIEKTYPENFLSNTIPLLSKPKEAGGLNLQIKLIQTETNRYHHWFGQMHQKIDNLPKTYDHVRFYGGLQEVADHPSKFIRELSHDIGFHQDKIIETFAEWVEKREIMKKLISALLLKK
ncbi:MAG: hypothetical protein WCT44_02380 [Candidatus Paceibacterota bacterium]